MLALAGRAAWSAPVTAGLAGFCGSYDPGSPLIMPLVSEHRGEIWCFDIEDGLEDRTWIGWFERRDVWHVANSFAEFMAGLRPDDSAAAYADSR